jgi:tetratricopeptide (TPR) repeat protein
MLRSRHLMRLWTTCIVAWAAISALAAGRARAETPDSLTTSEQRTAVAREHFDRGNSYFEGGKYDNAIKEFEQSYAIKPVPLLLFDIGNVARVSGKNEMAIEYFRRYLRTAPAGARERLEARRFLAEMTKPGYKAPAAEAPPPAETPPPPATPPPAPPAAVATPAPATPAAADKQPLYKKWWLWTAVGGAVVAVGLGVGLGVGLSSSGYTYPSVPGSVGTVRF